MSKKILKNAMLKYNIKAKLEKLPHEDYLKIKSSIPVALGITARTFEKYMYLKQNDEYSIPSDNLFKLATLFKCVPFELYNCEPDPLDFNTLLRPEGNAIAKKFNLTK